ncbi:hypothetical protein [Agrobacterium larrymoorei]|uniref:hypothetical protein n=1 Tax=Agrobacterium larrymoorei TaxID=160699 RepID=UPI00191FD710
MEVDDLVDAALIGLDRQEIRAITPAPDVADWEAFKQARTVLAHSIQQCTAGCANTGSNGTIDLPRICPTYFSDLQSRRRRPSLRLALYVPSIKGGMVRALFNQRTALPPS